MAFRKRLKTRKARKEILMKKRTGKKAAACVLAGAMVLSMMPILGTGVTSASAAAKVKLSKKQVTVTVKKKTTIKVKNTGKKKIKAKMANKKIATVKVSKKRLVITGKKAGKTKLTVTVKGMKNCSIPVIVKKANAAVTEATKTPAVTKIPSATKVPAVPTNAPAITQAPMTTETPSVTKSPDATETPSATADAYKNESDVSIITEIIREQRQKGASVSEDLDNTEQYIWKDGRLVEIYWSYLGVCDKLDVSGLTALTKLACSSNYWYSKKLSSLDVSQNIELMYLDCSNNELSNLVFHPLINSTF